MTKRKGRAPKGAILKKPLLLGAVFFALLSGVIYGTTFFGSNEAAEQALLSGQRVEISLSSGEVFGGISALNQNEAETKAPNLLENNENVADHLNAAEPAPIDTYQLGSMAETDVVDSNQTEQDLVPEPIEEGSQAVLGSVERTYGPEKQSDALPEQHLLPENEASSVTEEEQEFQVSSDELKAELAVSDVVQGVMLPDAKVEEVIDAPQVSSSEVLQSTKVPESPDTQVKVTVPADSEGVADASESDSKQPSATEEIPFTKEALESRRDEITLSANKKPIVIVITGVGLSVRTTERVLEMPVNYSIGFSPYAPDVAVWNKKAMVLGFDTLMHMPMETPDYSVDDPGPYALISTASAEENVSRLEMLLSLGVGFKGVYSSPNESFSSNMNNMRPVIAGLAEMQMPYLYGKGAGNVSLLQFAEQSNIKLVVNDVTLDDTISYDAIKSQLELLEKMASENEFAVGVARPYPLTLETLKFWQKGLEQKNFEVVPFSMLIDHLARKGN